MLWQMLEVDSVGVYCGSVSSLALAAAATDIWELRAGTGVRVCLIDLIVSGIATAAGASVLQLVSRSTQDTGGTSADVVPKPIIPGAPACVSVIRSYTANPSVGTLVATYWSGRLILPTALAASAVLATQTVSSFAKPWIRAGQSFSLNLAGVTIAGGSLDISCAFAEFPS